jgi:hypothetical protein
VQGKTSVLFGAISIVVFGVIIAVLTMMPQTVSQTQTDGLRNSVDLASRSHKQALGLLVGPTVKVDGELPPTFKAGSEDTITVLAEREQNTAVPERLEQIQKDIQTAVDGAPEALADAKAAAYLLLGQVHTAKAQYYLRSADNAVAQTAQAIVAIDTGILAVHGRLVNLRQIEPVTKTSVEATDTIKTDADEASVKKLTDAIAAKKTEISKLETQRTAHTARETQYSNEAGELKTLSAVAEGKKRLDLLEDSFAKEKLANKSGLDAEDAQDDIDTATAAVAVMNIELASAKAAIESSNLVLKKFSGSREANKTELNKETLAINTIAQEIAKNADTLIAASSRVDAEHALATKQYADALAAMKQFRQHASPSDPEAISSEAGILMGAAQAAQAVISSRKAVEATAAKLEAIWQTAALKGSPPMIAEMTAFAGKTQGDEAAAAESLALAAKLYGEATSKAEKYRWSYQRRELAARLARHRLKDDSDDLIRANALKKALEGIKGFPYVDGAL